MGKALNVTVNEKLEGLAIQEKAIIPPDLSEISPPPRSRKRSYSVAFFDYTINPKITWKTLSKRIKP